jgi:hypothetical protein
MASGLSEQLGQAAVMQWSVSCIIIIISSSNGSTSSA